MQTSRECVIKAIEGRGPDRVPLWLSFDTSPINRAVTDHLSVECRSDIQQVGYGVVNFRPIGPGYTLLGYRMETFGETMGESKDPPLADFDHFESWKNSLPDFGDPRCYEHLKKHRENHPDIFLVGKLNQMMEELINLMGYENYMISLYEEEENVSAVIDVLYDMAHKMVDGYADAGIDAVIAWEDWGLQNAPLMSHEMWEKFFKSKMRAFVDHIHARGMKYILHSCGHIVYLLDDFAEMGIDVLQLDQQMNMGLDELAKWRETFCFCCPTDIQHCMRMTDEEMTAYLREMNDKLGSGNGGFIFKPYSSPAAIHMTSEKLSHEIRSAQNLHISQKTADGAL